MSAERFRVRVTKDHLVFSAGHFITIDLPSGQICERLHGHNYRVSVRVEGPVGGDGGELGAVAGGPSDFEAVDDGDRPHVHAVDRVTAHDGDNRCMIEPRDGSTRRGAGISWWNGLSSQRLIVSSRFSISVRNSATASSRRPS